MTPKFFFVLLLQEYRFDYTRNSHNIVFLSSADQMALDSPFVQNLPWNTFGRKNVGYLYAISQGAKVIWDFDDDNLLKFWLKRAAPDDVLEIDSFIHYQDLPMVQPQSEQKQSVFNPYPVLGSSNSNCWPRGFPLDSIQKQKPQNQMVKVPKDEKTVVRFGVLQSLADFQPDVDAIFRLTQKTPFHFKRPDILKLHGGKKKTGSMSGHFLLHFVAFTKCYKKLQRCVKTCSDDGLKL